MEWCNKAANGEIDALIRDLERIDSEFRSATRTYSREHAERVKERLRAEREMVEAALAKVHSSGPTGHLVVTPTAWLQEVRNAAAVVSVADETLQRCEPRSQEEHLARAALHRGLERLEALLSEHDLATADLGELLA